METLPHIEIAIEIAQKDLNKVFPHLLHNLCYQHSDASGYWFAFDLVNDPRRQTYCVRPSDILSYKKEM